MQVIKATSEPWSEPPRAGSDIPERGTDLTITAQNWPEGDAPDYVVYNGYKSVSASIADSTDTTVTIRARIIRSSGVLNKTSERLNLSDRLVFTGREGERGFIGINEWQRVGETRRQK